MEFSFPLPFRFSLEVLLDRLLHLNLQVTGVASSAFHQLHLVRRLTLFFHNLQVRLLKCPVTEDAFSDYSEAAADKEYNNAPSEGDGLPQECSVFSVPQSALGPNSFPGIIQGANFELESPGWSGPYIPEGPLCCMAIPKSSCVQLPTNNISVPSSFLMGGCSCYSLLSFGTPSPQGLPQPKPERLSETLSNLHI